MVRLRPAIVPPAERASISDSWTAVADRELLKRFQRTRDEQAFAEIVDRHGGIVMAVCRRILRQEHDSEDAFQATFLVLAKRAGQIGWSESVAHWLYEVARRTALKLRGQRRVSANLGDAALSIDDPHSNEASDAELRELIDSELLSLPRRYVAPLVLCCVDDKSIAEAAADLGVSEGAVRARLWRGRELLRKRLSVRGIAFSLVGLAMGVRPSAASASPASVAAEAVAFVRDPSAVVSTTVHLAQGVLKAMYLEKLKWFTFAALGLILTLVGLVTAYAGLVKPLDAMPMACAEDGESIRLEGAVKSFDPDKKVIVVATEVDDVEQETSFALGNGAVVSFAGKKISPADIKPEMTARLKLTSNRETVLELDVSWPALKARIKTTDPDKRSITVLVESDDEQQATDTLSIGSEATIRLGGIDVPLQDLPVGREISFERALDKKSIVGVRGSFLPNCPRGTLKSLDRQKNIMIVGLAIGHDDEEENVEIAFELSKITTVCWLGKEANSSDLKPGMRIGFRLKDDRRTVDRIWASPPPPPEKDDDDKE